MMNQRSDPKSSDTSIEYFNSVIRAAPDESFHEMTGNKGDVILMHPLMLHSASKNGRRLARQCPSPFQVEVSLRVAADPSSGIITNPPVSLAAPFNFNRSNPADYSLVELKTMQDLGGPEKFTDWKITGEREQFAPERLGRQQKLREKEQERLRQLGLDTGDDSISQLPNLIVSKQQTTAATA